MLQGEGLTDWERSFLESVRGKGKLSRRQVGVLERIEAKVGGIG